MDSVTSGADTKPMSKKTLDAINEKKRIAKEKLLDKCSVEELVDALKKKIDKVEEIEACSTFDFTINTYYGDYTRSGPATILVVDKS